MISKIKTYGNTKLESLITSLKKKEGFGRSVVLMHPQQKEKASNKLYDFPKLSNNASNISLDSTLL